MRAYLPSDRHYVARAIQTEGKEVQLWDRLPQLHCPVLILRGGQEESMLKPEGTVNYLTRWPQARVIALSASGHALWEPDVGPFLAALRDFLSQVDERK